MKSLPDQFPILYHAHHDRHLEDLPFWSGLADCHGGPILELGCGSGRVLLRLAQAGHQVFGLDNARSMLAELQRNLSPDLRPRIHLIQADMAAFRFGMRFNLILLACNTFSTLSAAKRLSTLEHIRRHLGPDGVFAASLPNPAVLQNLPQGAEPELEETFSHPLDGQPVQVSSAWERTEHHFILHWFYDHLLPDGSVERVRATTCHELVSAENYLDELKSSGFREIESIGDFDGSPYSNVSPYLILLAS